MAIKTIKIDKQNLKVGYQDIELQIATPDFKKDILTDCYGQYIQRENVIQIQSDLTKLDEVNTVLHIGCWLLYCFCLHSKTIPLMIKHISLIVAGTSQKCAKSHPKMTQKSPFKYFPSVVSYRHIMRYPMFGMRQGSPMHTKAWEA